jgi:flagellar basal body-associated protein FliL
MALSRKSFELILKKGNLISLISVVLLLASLSISNLFITGLLHIVITIIIVLILIVILTLAILVVVYHVLFLSYVEDIEKDYEKRKDKENIELYTPTQEQVKDLVLDGYTEDDLAGAISFRETSSRKSEKELNEVEQQEAIFK